MKNLIKFFLGILPKILKPVIVGVPVIIINSKGEVLLGKRGKFLPLFGGIWGLPGGISEQGEKLIDTAKREVYEELGVKIKITKQSKNTYEVFPTKENPIHTIGIVFYGKIILGKPKPKSETQQIGWFTPKQIKKMKLAYNHKEILKKEGILK